MPRKKEQLNKREKTILKFIEKQIMTDGYPPSVREIGQAVGLSSTATVHGYLERLEKKGYIKKKDKKGRTLRLLKGSTGETKKTSSKDFYTQKELVEVPVVGKITAGMPILAVENVTDTFPIPIDFVGNSECFMLTVRGKCTYRSLVRINENAKNSKSSVSCESLMLDDISISDTIPVNDIRNDEVEFSHEAEIGKISDKAILYFNIIYIKVS